MPLNMVRTALWLATLPLMWWLAAAEPSHGSAAPKLAVVLVVDQFRYDYLLRFREQYLPARTPSGQVGGFRFLMEQGAHFTDARYNHYPLFTGPGHAVVLTGANPAMTGIAGNEWFDRATGEEVYCAADPAYQWVGGSPAGKLFGTSPANLGATTIGDQLKMATRGKARVVSISLKDRAAIFLGGRMADEVVWYDKRTGRWVTSTYYAADRHLPAWTEEKSSGGFVPSLVGKSWTPFSERTVTGEPRPSMAVAAADAGTPGAGFQHRLGDTAGPKFYDALTVTPFGNDLTLRAARAAVRSEHLGAGTATDLLAINLSSNDYVGHAYGPDSPEVADMCLRTDLQLAEFFRFLDGAVPGGLDRVLLVLTADHGVAPVPEEARQRKLDAGRIPFAAITQAANAALARQFGEGEWVTGFTEPALYLKASTLVERKVAPRDAEEVAARALEAVPGVLAAYTRSQILEGRLPDTPITRMVVNGYSRAVGGDVVVVPKPFWFLEDSVRATGHGTPYAYDTHVPLLLHGPGVQPGLYSRSVHLIDLAPTLAALLGTELPSGCEGQTLSEAVTPGGPVPMR